MSSVLLFPKTFHVTISATTIAIYGAIVSTATAIAQITTFLRDRVKIRIRVNREKYQDQTRIMLGSTPAPPSKPYIATLVRVANAGRRPVTISEIRACLLYPKANFRPERFDPAIPCELSEGRSVTAVIYKQDEPEGFDHIEFWAARDSVGRTFNLNIAPWYKRWGSALRRKFRIRERAQSQT